MPGRMPEEIALRATQNEREGERERERERKRKRVRQMGRETEGRRETDELDGEKEEAHLSPASVGNCI